MIKIGTRIDPTWLDRPKDLQFLKQIGVDVVDVTLDIFPGYKRNVSIEMRQLSLEFSEATDGIRWYSQVG